MVLRVDSAPASHRNPSSIPSIEQRQLGDLETNYAGSKDLDRHEISRFEMIQRRKAYHYAEEDDEQYKPGCPLPASTNHDEQRRDNECEREGYALQPLRWRAHILEAPRSTSIK